MALALPNRGAGSVRRPHVHELDRLRIETALSVVVVHVLMFTMFVEHSTLGFQVQSAFVFVFHFTRELFMFVTGFALVYVYFGKPFKWRYFWRKRGLGVLMPYVLWTIIYVLVNNPGKTWNALVGTTLFDIATGNASYQLYYILMTLQFYLLLPVFLWFLGRVRQHPWRVLIISFLLQVVELYLDYQFLSGPNASRDPVTQTINQYQLRFVLLYQFYFILGGIAALNLDKVRAFLARHGRWMLLVGVVALGTLLGTYIVKVAVFNISLGFVTTVFQPVLAIYCPGVVAFMGWLAYRSVQRTPAGADPRQPRHRVWAVLADASFGIYLVHPLCLTAVQTWVLPLFPAATSPWITLGVACVLTCSASVAATVILLRIPVLSRTVGREHMAPARSGAGRVIPASAQQAEKVA